MATFWVLIGVRMVASAVMVVAAGALLAPCTFPWCLPFPLMAGCRLQASAGLLLGAPGLLDAWLYRWSWLRRFGPSSLLPSSMLPSSLPGVALGLGGQWVRDGGKWCAMFGLSSCGGLV